MAEIKQETTLRDFLNVVFRRKYLILVIVGLTTFIVFYLKASQPQSYVSSSRTLVKRGERVDVFSNRPTLLTWTEEVSSQIEVILSDAVFAPARQIFADSLAARNMTGQLRFNSGSVRADVVGESNVFGIRYSAFNPLEARLGCAAMTEAYSRYYKARKTPPAVAGYFEGQINEVRVELEAAQREKRAYLNKADIYGVDDEVRLKLTKLTDLQTHLAATRSDVSAQRLRVDNMRKHTQMPNELLENSLSLSGSRNDLQTSIMSGIKRALQEERSKRESLLNRYTERHPEVMSCDRQIADLQAQLKSEVVNAFNVEEAVLQQLLAKVNSLQSEVNSVRMVIDELTRKEDELGKINDRIDTIQKKYELLLKKRDEAEIAMASSPEWEVTVLQSASEAWPQRTSDYVRLALGPLLSLILGLGMAFFLESMDHSLKNTAEVEEYLGKPVLANFREVKAGKRNVA